MPIYSYRDADGRIHERVYPLGKAPRRIGLKGGGFAKRDIPADFRLRPPQASTGDQAWPIHSDAVGVLPSQREEAIAEAARVGVPTDFDHQGRAILRSREHRKRYCEALGFYDRNGGYGDPQRGERCKIDLGDRRRATSPFVPAELQESIGTLAGE